MNVYFRYFLTLFFICTVLFVLVMLCGEPRLSTRQIGVCYLILLLVFIFPASFTIAFFADVVVIESEMDIHLVKERCDQIAHIKTDRVLTVENDDSFVYSYQAKIKGAHRFTRFGRWLTNPIVITYANNKTIIETPRAYKSMIEKCLSR